MAIAGRGIPSRLPERGERCGDEDGDDDERKACEAREAGIGNAHLGNRPVDTQVQECGVDQEEKNAYKEEGDCGRRCKSDKKRHDRVGKPARGGNQEVLRISDRACNAAGGDRERKGEKKHFRAGAGHAGIAKDKRRPDNGKGVVHQDCRSDARGKDEGKYETGAGPEPTEHGTAHPDAKPPLLKRRTDSESAEWLRSCLQDDGLIGKP